MITMVDRAILIPCPQHPKGKHRARLYCAPSESAGLWECSYGYSDEHEHDSLRVEEEEVTSFATPDIDRSYTVRFYVCETCGAQVGEAGDPDIDEADMRADAED